ncbi:MAG: gamma-glutamyltransferase family protein [Chloroflexi bacterium]|nr:gamma-glutamyltransferase family protein [Chloroflexota bacterium]
MRPCRRLCLVYCRNWRRPPGRQRHGSFVRSQNGRSLVYDFFSTTPGLEGSPPALGTLPKLSSTLALPPKASTWAGRRWPCPATSSAYVNWLAVMVACPYLTLLAPAIQLARAGFPWSHSRLSPANCSPPFYTHTEGMKAIFLPPTAA